MPSKPNFRGPGKVAGKISPNCEMLQILGFRAPGKANLPGTLGRHCLDLVPTFRAGCFSKSTVPAFSSFPAFRPGTADIMHVRLGVGMQRCRCPLAAAQANTVIARYVCAITVRASQVAVADRKDRAISRCTKLIVGGAPSMVKFIWNALKTLSEQILNFQVSYGWRSPKPKK